MNTPLIFNIQRFSIHDGPGIRSTVFLKGCPLRCAWCHNPESHSVGAQVGFWANRCTGCGACVTACPQKAIVFDEKAACITTHRIRCTGCGACVAACPAKARTLYGDSYTPEVLAEFLLRDEIYYRKSGGGITFSGGEPLLFADYVSQTSRLLKEHGIHIAIETSAYGSRQAADTLLASTDLFMTDIKAMDDRLHRTMTGVPLQPILDNIRYLSSRGAAVFVRIPVIVGLNDNEQTMSAAADFLLNETQVRQVELLKMHKLAQHKYDALGIAYPAADIPVPAEEAVLALAHCLAKRGLQVTYNHQAVF